MRKRKPPYILVSMLILLGSMLFYVSGGMYALANGDEPAPTAEVAPPTTGQARPAESRSDIAKATASAANAKPAGTAPRGTNHDNEPTIKIDSRQDYKPVPNDSNVGSGWYYDDARVPKAAGG